MPRGLKYEVQKIKAQFWLGPLTLPGPWTLTPLSPFSASVDHRWLAVNWCAGGRRLRATSERVVDVPPVNIAVSELVPDSSAALCGLSLSLSLSASAE